MLLPRSTNKIPLFPGCTWSRKSAKTAQKLLEKEVLDHPTIILPLSYITPGWKDKDYNDGWDEPLKIGGLHLPSRHCKFGFQPPSSPRPEAFQGHKSIIYLFDTWDYDARSIGVLVSHSQIRRFESRRGKHRLSSRKNPRGSNTRSDL